MANKNTLIIKKIALAALFLSILSLPAAASDDNETAGTDGFGMRRIENEDKISLPLEKMDEVWEYLNQTYINNSDFLKSLGENFTAYSSTEDFTDTYFDSPRLELHKLASGIRHRKRINLTDPEDIKNNRELVQIKLSDIPGNELSRTEIKFTVELSKTQKDQDDRSPVIGIIKKSERKKFKSEVEKIGINPYSLKPVVSLNQHRRRVYVLKDGVAFLSLSLDEVSAKKLWANIKFAEIEPELSEIEYTEANPADRIVMEEVQKKIIDDLKEKFPYIDQDLTPKYSKVIKILERKIPFFNILVRLSII